MPTYDYKCLDCEHRFEAFQSMTDEPLGACPVCGGKVKRLIGSGAGIIFRGSGFYCTDYRDSPSGGDKGEKAESAGTSGADSSSDTATAASSSTGSETKAGGKGEAKKEVGTS